MTIAIGVKEVAMRGKLGPIFYCRLKSNSSASPSQKRLLSINLASIYNDRRSYMEADRAHVDVGEDGAEKGTERIATRQPKKRFVGRRQAAESSMSRAGDGSAIEENGTIQSG